MAVIHGKDRKRAAHQPYQLLLSVTANQDPSYRHIIELLDWQNHPDQYIVVLERPLICMDSHLSIFSHRILPFYSGLPEERPKAEASSRGDALSGLVQCSN